ISYTAMPINNNPFHFERLAFKVIGVKLSSRNFVYKIYSFAVVFVIITYTVILFLDLIKKDINDGLDTWLGFIGSFGALTLIATTHYNRIAIDNILIKLFRSPFIPHSTDIANVKLFQKWYKYKNVQ
ncbi:hypothetical protein FQR65_LT06136, partial [Abscondita terminalis]